MRVTALFNHVGGLNLIGNKNKKKKKILTERKNITCKFPFMIYPACKYLILFNKSKYFFTCTAYIVFFVAKIIKNNPGAEIF